MNIILFFIGILVGILPCFLIYFLFIQKKLNKKLQLEQSIVDQKTQLLNDIQNLSQERDTYVATNQLLQEDIIKYQAEQNALIKSLETIKIQAKETTDAIYEKNFALMEATLEKSAEQLGEKYREEQESYQQEYLITLQDLAKSFADEVTEKKVEIANAEILLDELRAKTWAAIMADKRALEKQEEANFYRLNISKSDLEEIDKLKTVIPYLKDKEPLNKVIWKVYYEKLYTDLVGRVVGTEIRSGIYKITNLANQMCYVGQAVNIAERWKQHIKRGLGADTPTRNKLYPAMEEYGVENFSFEIIEECERSLLDSREDFWQDYFKAKEFGYSIK